MFSKVGIFATFVALIYAQNDYNSNSRTPFSNNFANNRQVSNNLGQSTDARRSDAAFNNRDNDANSNNGNSRVPTPNYQLDEANRNGGNNPNFSGSNSGMIRPSQSNLPTPTHYNSFHPLAFTPYYEAHPAHIHHHDVLPHQFHHYQHY